MTNSADQRLDSAVWVLQSTESRIVEKLSQEAEIPRTVARVLYQRGLTTAQKIRAFLDPTCYSHPDPFDMADMQTGVERIVKAIEAKERIVVYGDYDVDGQASTALLVSALAEVGAIVDFYLPNRLTEGYGLNEDSVTSLAQQADLLITVDCGITSTHEVALASSLGLDCIITDHHEPGPELPKACAVINPKRADCSYPEKTLAGCGVVYKLIDALYKTLGADPGRVERSMDLVALATIADVVPLRGENRAIVAKGLPLFSQRVGLSALCDVAGVASTEPSAGQVAFSLAPRLNAAGRLDDATVGVRILLTNDRDEAEALAQLLDRHNRERQEVEQKIFDEAQERIEKEADLKHDRALVVAGSGWHRGVTGIVASRLVEQYGRPTLVISTDGDESVGSGRSIAAFNLYDGLDALSDYFTRFGGHSMAAGFTLPTASLDAFRTDFLKVAREGLAPEDLRPRVRIDALVSPADLTMELADALANLGPFGFGNPEPVLALKQGTVLESRRVGRDRSHWQLSVAPYGDNGSLQAIGFRMGEAFGDNVKRGDRLDLAGSLSINEWRGQMRLQLQVRDARTSVTHDVHSAEEAILATPEVAATTEFAAPVVDTPVLTAKAADGAERTVDVHFVDGRHMEGDVRLASLQQARQTAETVLVWTEAPMSGVVSRHRWQEATDKAVEVIICSGKIPETARRVQRAALVYWSMPRDLRTVQATVQQVLGWGDRIDVYLTFNEHLTNRNERKVAADFPSIEILRHLYVEIRRRTRGGRGRINLTSLASAMTHRELAISTQGIAFGLDVFSESGLLTYVSVGTHDYEIELIDTEGRKVDLASGVRYNEGVLIREGFATYVTQIAAASSHDLLGMILGEVTRP